MSISIATKGFFSPPPEATTVVSVCNPEIVTDEVGAKSISTFEIKPSMQGNAPVQNVPIMGGS